MIPEINQKGLEPGPKYVRGPRTPIPIPDGQM